MKIELNDETLTAYALGELASDETKALEKLLAAAANSGNETPRKTLEEIRRATALVEEAFAEGPEAALTDAQRESVTAQVVKSRPLRWSRIVALAAGIALIATAWVASRMDGDTLLKIASDFRLESSGSRNESPAEKAKSEWKAIQEMQSQFKQFASISTKEDGLPTKEPDFKDPNVQAEISERYNLATEQRSRITQTNALSVATQAPAASSPGQTLGVNAGKSLLSSSGLKSKSSGARAGAMAFGVPVEAERLKSLGYGEAPAQAPQAPVGQVVTMVKDERGNTYQLAAVDAPRYYYVQPMPAESPGSESYKRIVDGGFLRVVDQPLSTFSIDVDTASYSNMRRYLEQGQLPPPDAVRVEELINYFDYAYPAPTDGTPFAAHFEAAKCPWAPEHTLVRIGLKGREVPRAQRPATNLVFLIDVSGSMQPENKLPLVKRSMAMLTKQLDERDRVSIVTYAGGVSLALPVTNGSQQDRILGAIDTLGAGGSTNGAGGIQLAYQSARENFLPGGVNRVILATDGDFNVGISDNDSLLGLIQQEAKSGVFLSVFGFGMGNLKDDKLEMLADKGNGVYGYIDSESEARKVFVEKLSGTLVTIAKDVKIQVEFNPGRVAAYRLIGYENRALAAQDFNDDRKDAGEIGAGHTVTALYEIVPAGKAIPAGGVDTLRYQSAGATAQEVAAQPVTPAAPPAHADELLLVKLRYKQPEGAESKLLEFPLKDEVADTLSPDLKFASAVAVFGKLLRGNPLGTALNYDGMMQLAQAGLMTSSDPHRAEMIHLMLEARPMIEANAPATVDPSRYQPVQ